MPSDHVSNLAMNRGSRGSSEPGVAFSDVQTVEESEDPHPSMRQLIK